MATGTMFDKNCCTYCLDEIDGLKVKCMDCENYISCLQCFSFGSEIGSHKNNHAYKFVDTNLLSVVSQAGWTAREECKLLDALEIYGFGNWEDIAIHVETRSIDEVQEECQRYLDGNLGLPLWEKAFAEARRKNVVEDLTSNEGPFTLDALAKLPPLDIKPEEAAQLGYMQQREDFEKEYENTSELLMSNLSMNSSEDTELDTALKLAQVDMYMSRLMERVKRRRVINDYQLVAKFFSLRKERPQDLKISRLHVEFENKFRPFTQFLTCEERDQLIASLCKEQELRNKCSQLCKYRENGITSFKDCEEFNKLAIAREPNTTTKSATDRYSDIPSWGSERKRVKKRSAKLKFNRKKIHLLHRTPANIAAFNQYRQTYGGTTTSSQSSDSE